MEQYSHLVVCWPFLLGRAGWSIYATVYVHIHYSIPVRMFTTGHHGCIRTSRDRLGFYAEIQYGLSRQCEKNIHGSKTLLQPKYTSTTLRTPYYRPIKIYPWCRGNSPLCAAWRNYKWSGKGGWIVLRRVVGVHCEHYIGEKDCTARFATGALWEIPD